MTDLKKMDAAFDALTEWPSMTPRAVFYAGWEARVCADDAQPVAITEKMVVAGVKALLQCAQSELESYSVTLLNAYEADVKRTFEAMLATRDAAPRADDWIAMPGELPVAPGNYLAMMVEDNSFGYTAAEPVIVEFDAYTDHPRQFTISDSWTNGPETATEEIAFWMPLPNPPIAASAPRDK